ncbi:GntR family transcriptional regulator [Curtobacterium citreum]|uniref:GntR family transcriptional regulator n=1 Tax=Curtobacterium citreum TaxID=2036 RepID=UPI00254277B7|nr:GntR family transcriptional regulator [Curtobacterium citreum]WIJ45661.1 GntR family transcriptional regulator [Curtobacterium citreum]
MLNGTSVIDAIRHDIVSGALQPGTRVTEAFLAERHGVSRVPVREALRGLEGEGFVVSRPNAGSRIADIPFDEADDLFAVRESLETATARRAATRARTLFDAPAPPEDWWRVRRELGEVLDAGDAAVARDELDLLVDLNERFHLLVAELSGSSTLATLLRQLSRKIEWLYALDTSSRGKRLWPDHRRILASIDAGDVDQAAERMAWHVRESRIGYAARTSPDRAADLRAAGPAVSGSARPDVSGSAGSSSGP